MNYPKILIVSRLNWDDKSVSNTLTNLFSDYDSTKIARIYIETQLPNTKCCQLFYQISEFSLVRKLWKWNQKTGRIINTSKDCKQSEIGDNIATREVSTMGFVRSHRSWIFSWLRELLWMFGGWKTNELRQFIEEFNPDLVWLDGSPLILMNRLNNYVLNIAKKPAVTFLMDDVYCYESCTGIMDKTFKYFLRKHVRQTVERCQHVFVSSQKMKTEYDRIFGIDSTFITKSFYTDTLKTNVDTIHNPIKMVYLGNVLIGRLDSLVHIAECMKVINEDRQKLQLAIYTNSHISEEDRKRLLIDDGVQLFPPVSYDKVPAIIADSDVQVFTESMDGKNMLVARLSFSTKIIDYIQSGKCILAVGPKEVAPIEYFKNEDAAIVATNKKELMDALVLLTDHTVIREYAEKAVDCGKRNHDRKMMYNKIYTILCNVANVSRNE